MKKIVVFIFMVLSLNLMSQCTIVECSFGCSSITLPDGIATNACADDFGTIEVKVMPISDCMNGEIGFHRVYYDLLSYEFISVSSNNNTFTHTFDQGGSFEFIEITDMIFANPADGRYDEYTVVLKPTVNWELNTNSQVGDILVSARTQDQDEVNIGNYTISSNQIDVVEEVLAGDETLSDHPVIYDQSGSGNFYGSLYIEEDLIIDINYGFEGDVTFHNRVYLESGSDIIVNPNVSTEFRYIDFIVCEDQTWDGFTLEDHASLILEENNIVDAEKAIAANSSANISIYNNNFTNNYYDLYLNGTSSDNLTIADFYGNTFENTGTLKQRPSGLPIPPVSPANIFVRNYPNTDLISVKDFGNVFRDADKAIDIEGTNAMIAWNTFETSGTGIEIGGASSASEIDDNIFTDKTNGIKVRIHAISSENNTFTNVDLGYSILGALNREVEIRYNNFDVNNKATYTVFNLGGIFFKNTVNILSDNSDAIGMDFFYTNDAMLHENTLNIEGIHAGLFFNTAIGNIIQENTINLKDPNFGTRAMDFMEATNTIASCNLLQGDYPESQTFSDGIGMFLQDAPSSIIACNDLDEIEDGIKYVGNSNNNRLEGNIFRDHGTALELGDQDFDLETVIGDQDHTGNRWFDTQAISARNNSTNISQSEFFVDGSILGNFLPSSLIIPSSGWFTDESESNAPSGSTFQCTGSEFECDGSPGTNFTFNPPSNDYITYIRTQLDNSTSVSTNEKWIWKNQILETIKNHVDPVQYTPAITALLTTLDNTIQDDFADVQVEINDALEPNSQINTLSAQILDNLELYTSSNDPTYLNNNIALTAQLNTAHQNAVTIMDLHLNNADAMLSGILIPTGDDVGQDYFDAYSILIKFIQSGYTLNSSQQTTLQAIAIKCPTEFGRAVSLARGMLRTIDGIVFDDLADCPVSSRQRSEIENDVQDKSVAIYPNPVTNILHFSAPIEQVTISDMAGKVLYKNHSAIISIPVAQFVPGMYTIRYQVNGEQNSDKFIKL